jgi:uncharacterized membrane protein YeaQ/YmgE (transglycosylase-associated protein family)
MSLIITLVLAGVVGWIASMIMKTDQEMGWIANVVAGVIGGLIGTSLLGFVSPATPTDNGFDIMGIIVGVIGACIAIFVWKAISGRKAL